MLTAWDELLRKNEQVLQQDPVSAKVILCQFQRYKENKSPTIAAPEIKAIPIEESHEPLINIEEIQHPRIRMMPRPNTPFESPSYHSGLPSACKIRKTLFECLKLMINKLDMLANQFGYAAEQISIRVFEGLRDLDTQKSLFEKKYQELASQNPSWAQEKIFQETSKWISPVKDNVPVHSTGGAIDIRLWDEINQTYLDMGSFGAIWGENLNAPTFSENISEKQKNNRLLAITAASQAGLINYSYEFWHFSCHDKYAEYWKDESTPRKAKYGSV